MHTLRHLFEDWQRLRCITHAQVLLDLLTHAATQRHQLPVLLFALLAGKAGGHGIGQTRPRLGQAHRQQ